MPLSTDSVIEAIPLAFHRMVRTLFQPFDLPKWLTLGFCAWLANLADGGASPSFNFNIGGPHGLDHQRGFPDFQAWFAENWPLVALAGTLLFVLIVAFTLLLLWLSSRGKFMFLDGVIHNRGAVVEPWRRWRQSANSLFGFRIAYVLLVLFALLVVGGMALGLAWTDIARGTFGPAAFSAIVLGALSVIAILLAAAIISSLLDDFIVPIMYLRGTRLGGAWGVFWRELAQGHLGPLLLFYVMKMVLSIAVAAVGLAAMCLTCCLVALPYVGTVILLPLLVFVRCYSLSFIEQSGPEWRLFAYDLEPRIPPEPGGEGAAPTGE